MASEENNNPADLEPQEDDIKGYIDFDENADDDTDVEIYNEAVANEDAENDDGVENDDGADQTQIPKQGEHANETQHEIHSTSQLATPEVTKVTEEVKEEWNITDDVNREAEPITIKEESVTENVDSVIENVDNTKGVEENNRVDTEICLVGNTGVQIKQENVEDDNETKNDEMMVVDEVIAEDLKKEVEEEGGSESWRVVDEMNEKEVKKEEDVTSTEPSNEESDEMKKVMGFNHFDTSKTPFMEVHPYVSDGKGGGGILVYEDGDVVLMDSKNERPRSSRPDRSPKREYSPPPRKRGRPHYRDEYPEDGHSRRDGRSSRRSDDDYDRKSERMRYYEEDYRRMEYAEDRGRRRRYYEEEDEYRERRRGRDDDGGRRWGEEERYSSRYKRARSPSEDYDDSGYDRQRHRDSSYDGLNEDMLKRCIKMFCEETLRSRRH